nr:hypothetical protein [Tanacetum cinerariifolium]
MGICSCGGCFKTHNLRSMCRHGKGSNFVSPPNCGDGVVSLFSKGLRTVKSISPKCCLGFSRVLKEAIDKVICIPDDISCSVSLLVLPLCLLKSFCSRSNLKCKSAIKHQRQKEIIVNVIRAWSLPGGSLQISVTLTQQDCITGSTPYGRAKECSKDGRGCGLHLNVDKTKVFWPMEDPRSMLAGIFPPNIARPLHGVKLLGGHASVDFYFSNELVMKRVAKTIELMNAIANINDPQCELLLLCSRSGISWLYFTMRTCLPRVFESAQRSFDGALRSSLKRIVTASGQGFMALWTSQREDHTFDWLRTTPISGLGQTMNSKTYRCVLCYRLGILLFSISKPCSACSRVFDGDIYGDHVVSCAGIIGIKIHHNVMRDTLVKTFYRSGISAGKKVDIKLDEGLPTNFL